ncbi:MAG: hypothetical protein RMH77_06530 [Sulfolobales archaeon]|nr:hypothetical protein [Sulfolobales archaeon]
MLVLGYYLTKYELRCEECGTSWELKVSYSLSEFQKLYHYCKVCRKNTFHNVLRTESAEVHTITNHER